MVEDGCVKVKATYSKVVFLLERFCLEAVCTVDCRSQNAAVRLKNARAAIKNLWKNIGIFKQSYPEALDARAADATIPTTHLCRVTLTHQVLFTLDVCELTQNTLNV